MSVVTSPNMLLPIPTVGNEQGPDYAFDINDSLTLIDQHDHTPGKGVQITPDGLNINSDLSFNDHAAIDLLATSYTPQSSAVSIVDSISVAPGIADPSIDNLWYTDSNGTQIQITQNGAIVPGTATVVGINYLAGTFTFTQAQSGFPSLVANLASGPITLYPSSETLPSSHSMTLSPPSGITTAYSLFLPDDPGALPNPYFLTIDSSGNIIAGVSESLGITNPMIANNTIMTSGATNKIVAGQQIPILTVSKTGSYTASSNDGMVLYDTSGGSTTLTLYSATVHPGYTIRIKKTSSDINELTIAAFGSEMIDGSAGTTINTQDEMLVLTSDGANWEIVDRYYPEEWIATTPTFTASPTPPTKGNSGSPAVDTLYYRRVGNTMVCRLEYFQTTAGTTGNGAYQIVIPGGWSIDATQITFNAGTGSGGVRLSNTVGNVQLATNTDFSINATVIAHDATSVTVQLYSQSGSMDFWASGFLSFGSTELSINGTFQIPISGWK